MNLPSGAATLPQENNQILIRLAGDARTRLIYHHADHLTGASVETDNTGTAIEVTDYYPYGSERLNSKVGRYNTPHKFTGKELDADTGLYDYGARYYDPVLSRFLSIDPWGGNLEDPQSLNKYSYTKNNPVKYVDPTGKNPLLAAMAVGAVGGAVWGAGIDVGIQLYQTGTINWHQVGESALIGGATGAVLGPIGEALAPATRRTVSGMIRGFFGEAEGMAGNVANQAIKQEIEVVQRAMSRAELEATERTGLIRGGREGDHFVSDSVNSDALRARQRLSLRQTPEVRATMEVPKGKFSKPTTAEPKYDMPGGGTERTATGNVPAKILKVHNY